MQPMLERKIESVGVYTKDFELVAAIANKKGRPFVKNGYAMCAIYFELV